MRNLELKVVVDHLTSVRAAARALGADDGGLSQDVDVYYRVQHGRLKLRQTAGQPAATLIAYLRPDSPGSRYSDYQLVLAPDPPALHAALAQSLGVLATVSKERRLLLYGQTRIHLDRVAGLGNFVELETVVAEPGEAEAEAEADSAHALVRDRLGLGDLVTVAGGYLDLLLARGR